MAVTQVLPQARDPARSRDSVINKGRQLAPPPLTFPVQSISGLLEQLVDIVPVDKIFEKRLQVIRTAVAVVDVIGVLPDVATEDRGRAVNQRVLAVRRLGYLQLAVLDLQPAPAGAELTDAGSGESVLNFSNPPRSSLIFFSRRPGSLLPPPFNFIQFQKCRWL